MELEKYGVDVYTVAISCALNYVPAFLRNEERTIYIGDVANDQHLDKLFEAL